MEGVLRTEYKYALISPAGTHPTGDGSGKLWNIEVSLYDFETVYGVMTYRAQ